MLQIDKVFNIAGVTVFGDHEKFNVFYPLPQQARYRLDKDGKPSFSFFKYRLPVDRPDGKKGGGFLLFDVEFVVDQVTLAQVKEQLAAQVTAEANRRRIDPVPEVVFGTITYTKGTSLLMYPEGMVQRFVPNGGKPSLFGNNITSFALELPPEGATFFEQAMQGEGGAVSVVYDLWFWARLPKVKVNARFHASKFYSFYQSIDTDWDVWSEDEYRETIREQMIQSESLVINFDWGGLTDAKLQEQIRDVATRTLEDMVERNMIEAIAPVPDDQRKVPDGIEDVTRDISSTKIGDVYFEWTDAKSVEWNLAPQGILPNITSLKDASGQPIKWSDYARTVDLDDPFFRTLRVNVSVNADFKNLPIHSVEVKLLYNDRPMANLAEGEPDGEVVLNSEDDVGKFAAFVEGDNWKYKYSYQVNYRGESRQFQSPVVETNEGNLTIGVDDVGLLAVDVSAGDLNWTEIERVSVVLTYEDAANGVEPIEEQFHLSQAAPTRRIQRVIFQPLRNKYRYRVKYFMKTGKEFQGPELESRTQTLFINDVFEGRKTVSVRGIGDFANRVQTIFVDLEYKDESNGYQLTRSQALSAASPFFEWTFPVIDASAGKVTYRATVAYKDGTSEEMDATVATSDTILLPTPAESYLNVEVITDLLPWDELKLVRVMLSYADPDNGVAASKPIVLSPAKKKEEPWRVELKDKEKDEFSYDVTFYMAAGTQHRVGPKVTRDPMLILDPPA